VQPCRGDLCIATARSPDKISNFLEMHDPHAHYSIYTLTDVVIRVRFSSEFFGEIDDVYFMHADSIANSKILHEKFSRVMPSY
jgi:hypothetical protein